MMSEHRLLFRRRRATTMSACALVAACVGSSAMAVPARQGVQAFPLETLAGVRLHNVAASAVTHHGKPGIRLTMSDALRKEYESKGPAEREAYTSGSGAVELMAVLDGVEFRNGTIEAEIAGTVNPILAGSAARGFVGIAFRVTDARTYDAFYLRPTNARADDQVRRNHSAQYIAHPDWTWFRLRKESPEKYESYVDLVPDEWTRVKIEVNGDRARLFVHDQPQPTVVVNDVKSGPTGSGGVALWMDFSTIAHFRNVSIRHGS